MEKEESTFKQMELKYCEGCGGLWLRRRGSERVYCASCVPKMADMPEPRRRGKARVQVPPADLEIESSGLELFGVVEGSQA
jgi:Zn-finger nucleic acid-binding protein